MNYDKKMPLLTKEQIDKLKKLDLELERKRKYDEKNHIRKYNESYRTGIPFDLVDIDVVKIGLFVGLLKSKDVFEGRKKSDDFSLLDIIMPTTKIKKYDFSLVPDYFDTYTDKVTEDDKISFHQLFVKNKCKKFTDYISSSIDKEIIILSTVIAVDNYDKNRGMESFVELCNENSIIVLDSLKDEDDDELWLQLSLLRNCTLGFISICEYKKYLKDQIDTLISYKKSYRKIFNHLSSIDSHLSLFGKFWIKSFTDLDNDRLLRELIIKSHVKDPSLQPFLFDTLYSFCCSPSLMKSNIEDVISNGIIGPYRNNCIGYLDYPCENYYALKDIIGGGIRLWVVDYNLLAICKKLCSSLILYCVDSFRIIYKARYGHNEYRSNPPYDCDALNNLARSIKWLNNSFLSIEFIKNVIKSNSSIIPTELDYFNTLTHDDVKYDNNKIISDDIIRLKLFDGSRARRSE